MPFLLLFYAHICTCINVCIYVYEKHIKATHHHKKGEKHMMKHTFNNGYTYEPYKGHWVVITPDGYICCHCDTAQDCQEEILLMTGEEKTA